MPGDITLERLLPFSAESGRAGLRLSGFPRIAELHEIACELWREAEMRMNTERMASMRQEWERKPGGGKSQRIQVTYKTSRMINEHWGRYGSKKLIIPSL